MGHGKQTGVMTIPIEERIRTLEGHYVASGVAVPVETFRSAKFADLHWNLGIYLGIAIRAKITPGTHRVEYCGRNFDVEIGAPVLLRGEDGTQREYAAIKGITPEQR